MADVTAVVPHDLAAEQSVIGAMLLDASKVPEVSALVDVGDFYSTRHKAIFSAVVSLHANGDRYDDYAIVAACEAAGAPVQATDITDALATTSTAWATHAARIRELRLRRDLLDLLVTGTPQASDLAVDVGDLVESLTHRLERLDRPAGRMPTSLHTIDQVADRAEECSPWVIPGLLRIGWRAVVVGLEGSGKSVLARQFATAVAAGIHPLHYRRIPPAATLLVDLENPGDVVTTGLRALRDTATGAGDWGDGTRGWVWEEPGGIDLRTRRDRNTLDGICTALKPDLVCLGPLYKAYLSGVRETDEQAVRDVQAVLDDLRTRHRFALMLEHHAPHDAAGSGGRRLRPFGSSLWLRWPEFGIALTPDDKNPRTVLHLKRWRGDRIKADWPDRIEHGTTWPWEGVWKNGVDESPF